VFDLGADTQFGTYAGLAAVPVQAAAVLGPSVAGLVVDATGSQRALFVVAAVALQRFPVGCATDTHNG
jgi:MFS-type transporter involved in bile tolerance (Atg22 family)